MEYTIISSKEEDAFLYNTSEYTNITIFGTV